MANTAVNTSTTQTEIVDIDVYGRTDETGQLILHDQDYALSNALVFWLTSKAGDYIYHPELGGILDKYKFKVMRSTESLDITKDLTAAIETYFGTYISVQQVTVTPDNVNRTYGIQILYTSLLTQDPNQVNFTIRPPTTKNTFTQTYEIAYIGDNLINFVLTQLPNYGGQPVKFNNDTQQWTWGPFILINLTSTSPELSTIQALVTGV